MTPDEQISVVAARMGDLSRDMNEVKDTMRQLTAAVTKLAVVEERQTADRQAIGRVFGELTKIDNRVTTLERAQPLQLQTSKIVQRVVWLVIAAVVGAGIGSAMLAPRPAVEVRTGQP